jgi:hypothetical protein
VATARLNDLDPETCLRRILECIPKHFVRHVADFLPWNLELSARYETDVALKQNS